jgi:putative oxidoreductase
MKELLDWNYIIGRILFSSIFLLSGINHFAKMDAMKQYASYKGTPAPGLMVPLTGLMILAGGLSILLGVYMEIGTWLIVLFLLPTSFLMHDFWKLPDPMERANQQAHFLKNMAMTGGALIVYWMVQVHGYGPFTLGEPMG